MDGRAYARGHKRHQHLRRQPAGGTRNRSRRMAIRRLGCRKGTCSRGRIHTHLHHRRVHTDPHKRQRGADRKDPLPLRDHPAARTCLQGRLPAQHRRHADLHRKRQGLHPPHPLHRHRQRQPLRRPHGMLRPRHQRHCRTRTDLALQLEPRLGPPRQLRILHRRRYAAPEPGSRLRSGRRMEPCLRTTFLQDQGRQTL